MERRPPLAVVFVVAALVIFLGGVVELGGSLFRTPGQVVPSVFRTGYLTPGDRVVAGGMYLPGGPARVGYSLDVRFQSSDTSQRVSCAFYAPNGEIGLLQVNSITLAGASGRTTHLARTAVYSAPRVQLEVVCFPRYPGVISISLDHLRLTSVPATQRECIGVC